MTPDRFEVNSLGYEFAKMKLYVDRSPANLMCKGRENKHLNIAPYWLATA